MNKIITLVAIITLSSSMTVLAKPIPHNNGGGFIGEPQITTQCSIDEDDCTKAGGFNGPSIERVTVEQAKNMKDDQRVILQGYIVQSLGDEDYLFKDDTGTIKVEIDNKRWRGQVVTPKDLVEIHGKVDKDWRSIEIDVKRIFKVNSPMPQGGYPGQRH